MYVAMPDLSALCTNAVRLLIYSWGESAGAISVALHMITNGGDTEGLFRGAFMQSGSPIPVGDISNGQKYYDALVDETGCSGTADTLQCLRAAPYGTLKSAVDKSPMIFAYQVKFILRVLSGEVLIRLVSEPCMASACRWHVLDGYAIQFSPARQRRRHPVHNRCVVIRLSDKLWI